MESKKDIIWNRIYGVIDNVNDKKGYYTSYMYDNTVNFEELLGKTIVEIQGAEEESEVILFVCSDGSMYVMYHEQDCCEDVSVNDICGDINRLIGSPILKAEKVTQGSGDDPADSHAGPREKYDEFYTWTFYHLATIKGYVTIRWYGTSNGWYSEEVDFVKIK